MALKVELLLPAEGHAAPVAIEGDAAPVLPGFTLEQARLGTVAGITDTAVEVVVLLVLLALLPVVPGTVPAELPVVLVTLPGVVVPVGVVVAVPGDGVGAIRMVTGAG